MRIHDPVLAAELESRRLRIEAMFDRVEADQRLLRSQITATRTALHAQIAAASH